MNYTVSNPTKMGVYVQNSPKKTISAAKAETGADVIVNFQLYNFSDFKAALELKLDGKILAHDGADYWGYAWNNGDTKLTLCKVYDGESRFDNFAGSVLVAKDGKAITNPVSGQALFPGVRGRTCIGRKANGDIVIYCWPDSSSGATSITQLGQKMVALGCIDAINYDGGGSCQMICPAGQVYPRRYVASFLWFNLPKAAPKPTTSTTPATPTIPANDGKSKEDLLEEGYRKVFYGKLGMSRAAWAQANGFTPQEFQAYINRRWPNAPKK